MKYPKCELRDYQNSRLDFPGMQSCYLNEPNKPCVPAGAPAEEVYRIVDFLNFEKSARYTKGGGKTHCDAAVADFVNCRNLFFPQMWWLQSVIDNAKNGKPWPEKAIYNENCYELDANQIYDWFEVYGETFGWDWCTDENLIQEKANQSYVTFISGKNSNKGGIGHLTNVIPESKIRNCFARRDNKGNVIALLQSAAGDKNENISWSTWYKRPEFVNSCKFWYHAGFTSI